MKNLLDSLNPAQREAVLATKGPVLIVAGAGAGKTKTLTHRIGHLIDEGVHPSQILAITFTNKAAKEMRERVFHILGRDEEANTHYLHRSKMPWIGTFHALGVYILREKGEAIGIARSANILDQDDALKLVRRSMTKAGIDPKQFEPRKIQSLISRHKGNLGTPENIHTLTHNRYLAETLKRVFMIYEASLREAGVLDFDDLLEKTVKLLREHDDIRRYYQTQWSYIHVDEYQDTNEVQYTLVQLLTGEKKNICVVGDSDQNIYSWRGASIANILNFENDYPGARVILLEQNYRSTQTILSAANDVIRKNTMRKEKTLFTENEAGEQVSLFASYDESDEAQYVAGKIGNLIASGTRPRDIAVLYRTNFQSRILEEALLFAGIPYQVLGVRFYERKEVKDVISYLRAGINQQSVFDLERVINVPARGVGKVTLEKILRGERAALPLAMKQKVDKFFALLDSIKQHVDTDKPSQLIAFIIKETGIEHMLTTGDDEDTERLANVRELVSVATRYDLFEGREGIEQFLSDVALESDQDTMKGEVDAVRLMTVHASKGLEFDRVFVTGMEQDLFPSRRSQEEGKDVSEREEERRLFYVALTRAAKKVFLSYASFRTIFGNRQVNLPSEFLSDISSHLVAEESRGERVLDGGRRKSLLEWDDDNNSVIYI
jgi:DNA helicase-2/ATP-dependent DNA helicase PcrA